MLCGQRAPEYSCSSILEILNLNGVPNEMPGVRGWRDRNRERERILCGVGSLIADFGQGIQLSHAHPAGRQPELINILISSLPSPFIFDFFFKEAKFA